MDVRRTGRSTYARAALRLGVAAAAVVCLVAQSALPASSRPEPAAPDPAERERLLRVVAPGVARMPVLEAAGFDVLELREGADFFVLGDAATADALRDRGLDVRAERLPNPSADELATTGVDLTSPFGEPYPTFYGGYHTTQAQLDHLADVAEAEPDVARLVDVGDSWRKATGRGGHDILALCLTAMTAASCALSPEESKPRLLVVTNIHAREIATAEVAWELVDELATKFGTNERITTLLEQVEVWVVPMANPDGHDVVEKGRREPRYQRKNRNTNDANCRGTNIGTDLNRNFGYRWGGVGASRRPCSETFRGRSAASEPETVALRGLASDLFADRRGEGPDAAAPRSTTGVSMVYHSFGGLVLYPWGYTRQDAPNGPGLRRLAKGAAEFTGYRVGQPGEVLYPVSGSTDDGIYGRLGVPALTTELGGRGRCAGFFPDYECVASTIWPAQRKVLLWLAEQTPSPYRLD